MQFGRQPLSVAKIVLVIALGLTVPLITMVWRASVDFSKIYPKAHDGLLDLSTWRFQQDGIVPLDGEWHFYWKQLLTPELLQTQQSSRSLISVPAPWNDSNQPGGGYSANGYGTYFLRVLLPHREGVLGVMTSRIGHACDIWTNGKLAYSLGKVGTSLETMEPKTKSDLFFIAHNTNELEIVIQVSNFVHRSGGLRHGIGLGLQQSMLKKRTSSIASELVVAGSLLIMGLYHFFTLFWLREDDGSVLFFAILCFSIGLRILATGETILLMLYPGLSWDLLLRIEYAMMPIIGYLYMQFIQKLFLIKQFDTYIRIFGYITLILVFIIALFPVSVFSNLLIVIQIEMAVGIAFTYLILIKGRKYDRDISIIFIVGSSVVIPFLTNDVLHVLHVINTVEMSHVGFFVFIVIQAVALSFRYAKNYHKVKYLSNHLELLVEQRTTELNQTNKQLETEISIRKRAESDLKRSLTEKETLLLEILHRVKNNMQIVLSMLKINIRNSTNKDVIQILETTQGRIETMSLIHNILYNSENIKYIDLTHYFEKIILGIQSIIDTSALNVAFEVTGVKTQLEIDQAIPCGLIVNEIVFNSLKHAFPDQRAGLVTVEVKNGTNKTITISVSDNGVGIDESIDFNNSGSLGLSIIQLLAQNQLQGSIELNRQQGTHYDIRFNLKEQRSE